MPKVIPAENQVSTGVTQIERNAIAASAKQIGGDHYKDFAIQPSEFIYKNNIEWLEGNAIKYICRHRLKGGAQDIKKAIHYLQLILEWIYGKPEEKA